MVTWQDVEAAVGRAVRHFKGVDGIASPDNYTAEMAIRHALQCGIRELGDALSMLQRLHRKGAGFSLLSHECRKAYLALRALDYEEMVEPSAIGIGTLQEAIAAAKVMAEFLQADFDRIRKEMSDA
jgi:hypothetical protein